MPLALTRILLITLALALNGQAFAAPCAGGKSGGEQGGEHHQSGHTVKHCAPEAHHCAAAGTARFSKVQDSGTESCEQACSCCPGHCASAVPGNELTGAANHYAIASTLYSEIHSTPHPETALRPPITA
ncbi:hypothetical protein [Microbulbifer yueqingensis]|nr:hypothetical protein [Microbulbifer yueqingensis]